MCIMKERKDFFGGGDFANLEVITSTNNTSEHIQTYRTCSNPSITAHKVHNLFASHYSHSQLILNLYNRSYFQTSVIYNCFQMTTSSLSLIQDNNFAPFSWDENSRSDSPSLSTTPYTPSSHHHSSRHHSIISHNFPLTNSQLDNPFTRLQHTEHLYNQMKIAHKKLHQELSNTKIELNTLMFVQSCCEMTFAKLRHFRSAHDKLLLSIAESPALSTSIISYNTSRFSPTDGRPSHLKKVQFWKRKEYAMEKKKKKGITGISRGPIREGNTMTWYVQDKDGNPVDAERVSNIRQRARAIWQQLLCMGIAPNSWAQAGLDAYDLYEHHMVE